MTFTKTPLSLVTLLILSLVRPADSAEPKQLVSAVGNLSPTILTKDQRRSLNRAAYQALRKLGRETNARDIANWRKIRSQADWEKFRDVRIERLRKALGTFPPKPSRPTYHISKKYVGDQFVVNNLVYRTRPNFWVTANLYAPAGTKPEKRPGILIVHSHHRPKTQGELQDMGMTWARRGCYVLVIDQVGHGERADHPFQSKNDYKADRSYRWWRQDYYHRAITNQQLHTAGESLMGWMAWDLMRGVDLLLQQPRIDDKKIIILGAVAGGGDPAGVTAALDKRITAAVPFNFGGPQPENRYPLPDDAETSFNYLGGAYWDNTRNLRRTAADGFLHWVIVGSLAPRHLIYAHEFAWDRPRDPVWKRLQQIWGYYGAQDRIDYTLGAGSVRGSSKQDTHCTNIGKYHRKRIHAAFRRWFDIDVQPQHEYRKRLSAKQLRSMTEQLRRKLKPLPLHQVVSRISRSKIAKAQRTNRALSLAQRRQRLRMDWRELLGNIDPKPSPVLVKAVRKQVGNSGLVVHRLTIQTEPGIVLPLMLLQPSKKQKPSPTLLGVSERGISSFLSERSVEIAQAITRGSTVCLAEVRPAGGSTHDYGLFFDTPVAGHQVRDLRTILRYLRTRPDINKSFVLWGDSLTRPSDPKSDFRIPFRVSAPLPKKSPSLGGLLVMITALYEPGIHGVYVRGGLSSYLRTLDSPHIRVQVRLPGVITKGDLPELAAALAPARLGLDGLVDGLNRRLPASTVRADYRSASLAYKAAGGKMAVSARPTSDGLTWILDQTKK